MGQMTTSAVFPYPLNDLYDLVMKAEDYPSLSSYIKHVSVTEQGPKTRVVDAALGIAGLPEIHYGCTLERTVPNRITAVATNSPFRSMAGQLTFATLPNGHTKVDCRLDYDTGWNPIAMMAAKLMQSRIDQGIQHVRDVLKGRWTPLPDSPAPPRPPVPGMAP